MRTTIRDIANKVGVSHATVSRVLNGRGAGFISETTRQRVLTASQQMNYRPNLSARALVTGRTRSVAIWMHTIGTPFYTQVLQHLEEQITSHGYTVTLARTLTPYETLAQMLESNAVDGVIAVDLLRDSADSSLYASERTHPVVFLGVHSPEAADYVRVDLKVAVREALLHLLSQGCKRLAYIASAAMAHSGEERLEVYQSIMQEANRQPEVIMLPSIVRSAVRESLSNYIRLQGSPDGLLCQNDDVAMGAFRSIRDMGLRIPNDVRLVGCDGIEELQYFDPPISTIVQPITEMCSLAWKFLEQRIDYPSLPPQGVTLTAQLKVSGSSRQESSDQVTE